MKMVKKFFFLDQENEMLANRFWPGPLTLILKRKSLQIPKSLTINNDCAVRIPKNDFTIEVIKKINLPLIMPSANRFKKLSPIWSIFLIVLNSASRIEFKKHCFCNV